MLKDYLIVMLKPASGFKRIRSRGGLATPALYVILTSIAGSIGAYVTSIFRPEAYISGVGWVLKTWTFKAYVLGFLVRPLIGLASWLVLSVLSWIIAKVIAERDRLGGWLMFTSASTGPRLILAAPWGLLPVYNVIVVISSVWCLTLTIIAAKHYYILSWEKAAGVSSLHVLAGVYNIVVSLKYLM